MKNHFFYFIVVVKLKKKLDAWNKSSLLYPFIVYKEEDVTWNWWLLSAGWLAKMVTKTKNENKTKKKNYKSFDPNKGKKKKKIFKREQQKKKMPLQRKTKKLKMTALQRLLQVPNNSCKVFAICLVVWVYCLVITEYQSTSQISKNNSK